MLCEQCGCDPCKDILNVITTIGYADCSMEQPGVQDRLIELVKAFVRLEGQGKEK